MHLRLISTSLPCTSLTAIALMATSLMAAHGQSVSPDLLALYKDLHSHPELSHHEERTSGIVADALRTDGYAVTDHIGIYPDGSHGFGVVGILKNGPGPTLLIRADMDALPIVEETGLPYASHVRSKNAADQDVGVMHACGHDIHTTVLLGVARNLMAQKGNWHGTVICLRSRQKRRLMEPRPCLPTTSMSAWASPTW